MVNECSPLVVARDGGGRGSHQVPSLQAEGEDYLLDTIKGVLNLGVDPLNLIAKVSPSFDPETQILTNPRP